MEMKGLIFTTDAILACAVAILLISTLAILEFEKPRGYSQKLHMEFSAGDSALMDFYTGSSAADAPAADEIHCVEMYDYGSAGTFITKVKKCTTP